MVAGFFKIVAILYGIGIVLYVLGSLSNARRSRSSGAARMYAELARQKALRSGPRPQSRLVSFEAHCDQHEDAR
jgi:hypothetical protein